MTKRLTIHIQQNTTPERVATILDCLAVETRNAVETYIEDIAALCNLKSSVLQKNVFPFLRHLSILGRKTTLTELGQIAAKIQQLNPDILGEFLHLLMYQLHLEDNERRFSWAYATVVEQLWERQEVILSPVEKKSIVAETIAKAAAKFELETNEIAFSASSISGVLNWLRSLSPGVIKSAGKFESFSRRYFCSAPIFLMAVNAIYKQRQQPYGTKIFLRQEIKDAICQMLLLDTTGLDGTLDNAKCTYDYDQGGIFDWGYEGGYGQWMLLTKSPDWTELI